ncbi:hypothetical protein EDB83DRAFT_2318154 [Lactarius deliciosus]|nr:hypothetical protein EDB83DRAFT_2318154 [Lactarius deliciosus]
MTMTMTLQTTSGQLQIVLITGNPWVTHGSLRPYPYPHPCETRTRAHGYGYQSLQPAASSLPPAVIASPLSSFTLLLTLSRRSTLPCRCLVVILHPVIVVPLVGVGHRLLWLNWLNHPCCLAITPATGVVAVGAIAVAFGTCIVVDFDHCCRYRLRSISQVYTSEKMASRPLPLQGKRAARTMQKQQDDGNGHSADEVPSHVRFNDIHESTTTQTGALP